MPPRAILAAGYPMDGHCVQPAAQLANHALTAERTKAQARTNGARYVATAMTATQPLIGPATIYGSVERLFHFGMCPRCAAAWRWTSSIGMTAAEFPRGSMLPASAFAISDPLPLAQLDFYSPAIPPLRRLLEEQRPITHEALDELPNKRSMRALQQSPTAPCCPPETSNSLPAHAG